MSFSNEDRDRLKHQISKLSIVTLYTSTLNDIFARLEVAENYCLLQGPSTPAAEMAYDAWRKETGK